MPGAGTTTQDLTGLIPNTRYTVQVRAVNLHDHGERSPYRGDQDPSQPQADPA